MERKILSFFFSLVVAAGAFGGDFQSSDLVGSWTGTDTDGTKVTLQFHKDGSATWDVDEPNFKRLAPSGLKAKYSIREKSPVWELDIYDFDSAAFKDGVFQAILQPVEMGKIRMNGAWSKHGLRPTSFGKGTIVISKTDV
jgi:hypothetical protein